MKKKAQIEDIYPLTPMQEGMLFHSLKKDTRSAYFEQMSFRVNGRLVVDYLKKSLQDIMKRHDVLRTVFLHENVKKTVQVVMKERASDFSYRDISGVKSTAEKEEIVKKTIEQDRRRSFVLSRDVLIRVSLLKLGEEEYHFTWSHPHIIMDGWCIGIIISEFIAIYRAYLENRPIMLPPIRSYKDYIKWLAKRDIHESLEFWARYLEGYGEPAPIPRTGQLDGKTGDFDKRSVTVTLDPAGSASLKRFAASASVTLNVVVQAAWGIVLGKYKGEKDVVFGRVVSGRPPEIAGVESMIGLFLNTLPLRIRTESGERFYDLVRRVQEEDLESEPHHFCPLVKIQGRSALKGRLFDHIMVFQNFPVSDMLTGKEGAKQALFRVSGVEKFEHTSYDFVLHASAREGITLSFDYNSRIYPREVIEGMSRLLEKILSRDLEEVRIEELESLYEGKKREILASFNDDLENE